jgi:NAD(P)-dependent dehydrogenase (short-subunit alcohol dehydrogenase family)
MSGRVAFIAGGSSGIGLATAAQLAAQGFRVTVAGRDEARLAAVRAQLSGTGHGLETIAMDITDDASCAAAVDGVVERHGGLDVLVNSVGSAPSGTFDQVAPAAWAAALDGKVLGAVRLMSGVLPVMRAGGYGRIVNVAGTAGVEPDPWMPVAGAANAALLAVTKAASLQLAADGITVNAVLPGPTRTGRWEGLVRAHAEREGLPDAAARAELERRIPTGRPAEPADIAAYIGFLASEPAGHITGTGLAVDGGQMRSI